MLLPLLKPSPVISVNVVASDVVGGETSRKLFVVEFDSDASGDLFVDLLLLTKNPATLLHPLMNLSKKFRVKLTLKWNGTLV